MSLKSRTTELTFYIINQKGYEYTASSLGFESMFTHLEMDDLLVEQYGTARKL